MPKLGLTKDNLISRGAARTSELVYLAMQDRKLHKKSVPHTRIGGIYQGQVVGAADLAWRAAAMCVVRKPSEKLVVVSESGEVFTYVGGVESAERLDQDVRQIRGCSTIAGMAYACGMSRQVYRRAAEGKWTPMHAPADEGDEITGFEAIDGFSEQDLYAVGWQGEVWHCAKGRWERQSSPVNIILSAVCAAGDKLVYACGQSGTLIRGRAGAWEQINTDGVVDDLWDVRWFEGKLYVASMSTLYVLFPDGLHPVDFGKEAPRSCYKLTDAQGVLWSVGQENVFSFDGKAWTRWD